MKKRLLCALLAAAMCFGETLSASAVTVSTNDVEMEQTGTISENTTEVDAEKEAATIYPDGKVPTKFPKGQGYELKMYVTPDTKYSVAVYDAKNEMVSYTMGFSAKAPFGQEGEVLETVKLEFDKLAVGNYELKYWIGGLDSANASTAQGKTIYVRKSILKKENENITEVTVSKAVYTGKSVKPVVKIVETEGDNTYTLVEGKDFSYEVTSANKKEMGTATVTIMGMNDYMGTMTADFDITPQAPAITGAVCTGFNSARITWNAVANANGYILERKAGTGNFAQVATLASGATSYEDTTGLVTGETYYYRIVAKADSKTNANQYVESERNENGVAVKITPSSPKLISLESTSYNKLKLTWNTVNGATGYLVYQILAWIRNTRTWALLRGVLVILGFLMVAAIFNMTTIIWIAGKIFSVAAIAIVVILQPELRRALEQLGQKNIFSSLLPFETAKVPEGRFSDKTRNEIIKACYEMGKVRTGALIVIEQNTTLAEYERTGIEVDGIVTSQLLINIFEHNTPLHDGAVIIRGNRVTWATCYLPLSDNMELSKELGTRHRAGVGISECTDSLTIIVSEETGRVSVAYGGKLTRNVDADMLREKMEMIQNKDTDDKKKKKITWKGRGKREES